MARIIKPSTKGPKKAIYLHEACGAVVEFYMSDVKGDSRDGDYVECPACREFINAQLLVWGREIDSGTGVPK